MKTFIYIAFIFVWLLPSSCRSQQEIQVTKIPFKGKHEIVLKYADAQQQLETYSAGCAMKEFTFLPDLLKIKAIEKLLTFENDTSICSAEVTQYHTGYFKGKKPESKSYTLQVSALYYINYLAFSGASLFYSPFPVLYDTLNKREVNLSQADIKQVYKEYKTWFEHIKKNGFNNYVFPLNESQYQWFGTVRQNTVFEKYPVWTKEDGCKFWDEEEQ